MQKRVGIITIFDLTNYGNRLQNYAVQKILTDQGFEAKTFHTNVFSFGFGWKYRTKKLIHVLTGYHLSKNRADWDQRNKNDLFERFTKRYLPTEKVESIDGLAENADFFVIGSDQVWNPVWYRSNIQDLYLLTFAKPEQKVCLSPSFGISGLPDDWKPFFRENLKTFPSLNVREKVGAEIIKELTGRDAQVTIDPTLMLDAEEWLKVAKKPHGVATRKPFLLTYFLGERTEKTQKDIDEIMKLRDLKVYHLLDLSQPRVYACGPSEFVYLFSKADIVLTDSFHACVFSFLFNKPFVVYDRVQKGWRSMNSRLESLLSMLQLERKYRDKNLGIDWFECDYTDGWTVLKEERKKLKEYLIRELNP